MRERTKKASSLPLDILVGEYLLWKWIRSFFPKNRSQKIQESPKPSWHIQLLSLLIFTPHLEDSVWDLVSRPKALPQRTLHFRSYEPLLAPLLALGYQSPGPFDFGGAHYKWAYRVPWDSVNHVSRRVSHLELVSGKHQERQHTPYLPSLWFSFSL